MIDERRVRLLAVVSMVALFASGIAIGVAMDRLLPMFAAPPVGPAHGPGVTPIVDRFAAEVGLRSEQREAVRAILEQGRERADRIMEQNRPALDEIRRNMEEKIVALLDAEQTARYRELLGRGHPIPARPPDGGGPPPPLPPGKHLPPFGGLPPPQGHPPPPMR